MTIPFQFKMPKFEAEEIPFDAQPPWYQEPTTILLGILVVTAIVGVALYHKNSGEK
ncbi:hypothetical protein [Amylibacter sp. IMCC11727]|uniref:hypothetical protein n=1 Tax=Amylibacter sp. IMCC11727 TaxID=3039851 RepID=UPI00244E2EA0|nr:hypothetical protein [Amylibacter sp. IMCC11727]WGI22144.1 hypothetical protein QBD29_01620 [Amylibacter sp. IMCC11727]